MKRLLLITTLCFVMFFDHSISWAQILDKCLYVQFERRGAPSGYWSGDVVQQFYDVDDVVGHTVADEVSLQLDSMREMGVNSLAFELRSSNPTWNPGPFTPPECNIAPALGLQWPQPTPRESGNLVAFLDLVGSKGMKVFLRLVNTHMEELSSSNNSTWIGTILGAIKDHPALDLVLFEGNTHQLDTDGDGVEDSCGIPAEPPLWLGPASIPSQYIKWAISYSLTLGLPARKLSAQAVVGDYFVNSEGPAGPEATGGHLWKPIVVLKQLFDELLIPNDQRTYAISLYEHRKCSTARGLPCVDQDANAWADQTIQDVLDTVGRGNGSRVVAVEMGALPPVEANWTTEQAVESLFLLMKKHGVDGGCFWRWTNFDNDEDLDLFLATPVKKRGVDFLYTPMRDMIAEHYIETSPYLGSSQAAYDGWILESNETSSRGGKLNVGGTTLLVGDDAANRQYRAILSFDTTTVPNNAIITSATLKLKPAGVKGSNPFLTHKGLLVDIRLGAFSTNATLQAADFRAPASMGAVGRIDRTLAADWYSFNLPVGAFPFINRTGLTQLRLRFARDDNQDLGADYLKLFSGNANPADRPTLTVSFSIPALAR